MHILHPGLSLAFLHADFFNPGLNLSPGQYDSHYISTSPWNISEYMSICLPDCSHSRVIKKHPERSFYIIHIHICMYIKLCFLSE